MKFVVSTLLLVFLTSACCTKKDCGLAYQPSLNILLDGFESEELSDVALLFINRNSGAVEDSIVKTWSRNIVNIDFMSMQTRDMRTFDYVIKTSAPTTDTIRNLTYTQQNIMIPCNECFYGNGSVQATEYKDFSYQYNGQTLTNDTLIITR